MPDSVPSFPSVKPRPWGIGATFGFSLIVFAVFLLIQTLLFLVILGLKLSENPGLSTEALAGNLASNGLVLAISTIVANPICTALVVLFARLRRQLPVKTYLGLKRPSKRQLVEWCLITIVSIVLVDLLKSFVDRPVVPSFVSDIYTSSYFLPAFLLALVVMAPIFEEVFFRGFIMQGIRHSFLGKTGAIVIPALLWAIVHLQYDWLDVAGIFIFGIVLGMAQLKTGSLYVAIAMHALNNLLAVIQVAIHVHFNFS